MFDFSYTNILHSNLVNFILMLVLFGVIFAFLNVPKMFKNSINQIKDDIEKSNDEKENSERELRDAEIKLKNSDNEVQTIIDDANKISNDYMEKAKNDAEALIGGIKQDYEQIFEREVFKIKKDVAYSVSAKSIQKTEEKLRETFKSKDAQESYIKSSIEKLEGIEL